MALASPMLHLLVSLDHKFLLVLLVLIVPHWVLTTAHLLVLIGTSQVLSVLLVTIMELTVLLAVLLSAPHVLIVQVKF